MTNETLNNPKTPTKSTTETPVAKEANRTGNPKRPGLFKSIFGRNQEMPEYGGLYFEHLRGEFLLIRKIDPADDAIRKEIEEKHKSGELNWNDIYTYQMILVNYQDSETLKSRIVSLRIKFQNLADANEYADYLTFRAVNLKELSDSPPQQQPRSPSNPNTEKLRSDLKYLLDEFYMRYAYIAARETLRSKLLRNGAIFTLVFFIFAIGFLIWNFVTPPDSSLTKSIFPFTTLIAVVFAGIFGAFVSMQERLQNTQAKGDPIYNLSLLTHGWLSIVLSPISGAIFAVLIYLFFAGKFLEGGVFPSITQGAQNFYTLGDKTYWYMSLKGFILGSHPETSKDYALLLIWSFIAGFAERFVPDALMRVVSTKKSKDEAAA